MSNAGRKIIEGLKDAIAGNCAAVVIEGQRWVHEDKSEIARLRREKAALVAPYRNADETDWAKLDDRLGHGGHGQFWRAVFEEVRAALRSATEKGEPT